MGLEEMLDSGNVYRKEDFKKHIGQLCPAGYQIDSDSFFNKSETGKQIALCYDITEDYPFDVSFGGFSVLVRFTDVENIFYSVYKDFKKDMHYPLDTQAITFNLDFDRNVIGEEGRIFLIDNTVYDDGSFYVVKPYLDRMMKAGLEFVDKYKTLEDFYNYGEQLSLDDKRLFYNQPFPPRLMIVKKLLGKSDYNEYADRIVTNCWNRGPNSPLANFVAALKAYLDTM